MIAKGRFMIQPKTDGNSGGTSASGAKEQQPQQHATSDSTPSPAGSNYTTASESGNNPPEGSLPGSVEVDQQRQPEGNQGQHQPPTQIQHNLQVLREQLKQIHLQQPHPEQPPQQLGTTAQPPTQMPAPVLPQPLPHPYNTVSGGVPAEQPSQQFQSDQQPAMQQLSQHQQHMLLHQQSATHSLPPTSPSQQLLQHQQKAAALHEAEVRSLSLDIGPRRVSPI